MITANKKICLLAVLLFAGIPCLGQYVQKIDGKFHKEDFFLLGAERSKLINALFKNGNGSPSSHTVWWSQVSRPKIAKVKLINLGYQNQVSCPFLKAA